MMKITPENKDKYLVIHIEGRIDSSNATDAEKQIFEAVESCNHEEIALNLHNLEYISSAGLRVILRLRKSEPNLTIYEVNNDIYNILELTGFTEMLTVVKQLREISIDGCEEIGHGANGNVYRIDVDTAIKVYNDPDCLVDVKREIALARKAFILGIPTAIPYDVVKVNKSYGSIFELLNAKSFAKLIISEPSNIDKYIDMYVDLLKKIHSTEVNPEDMPDKKTDFIERLKCLEKHLPTATYDKLLSLLNAVPNSNNMIHGDYHVKNVMLQNGETLLIDMDTLSHGNAVFEFGPIYLAYIGFSENDHSNVKGFLGFSFETATHIWNKLLEQYFNTTDSSLLKNYEDKARIIGYIRKMEREIRHNGGQTPQSAIEIESCKKQLIELANKVDSLAY